MAINLDDRYPGRANGKTLSYPQGSFKNRTSPTAKDGTYLEQDWANDQLAFFQSLMSDAGMTANGAVDTVTASQYFDALIQAVGNRFAPVKTYAQAIALTEDIGPIAVIGMDGIWEWSTSAYFTGYRHPRCGHWEDGWTPTPLAFQLEAHGGVWSEADPKEKRVIARFRESGLVVAIGSWVAGQGKIADLGGGNWKAVDYQNMHKRAAGTDADTANAAATGVTKGDTQKIHSHNLKLITGASIATGGNNSYTTSVTSSAGVLDATSSVGTTETAPKHTRVGAFVHC